MSEKFENKIEDTNKEPSSESVKPMYELHPEARPVPSNALIEKLNIRESEKGVEGGFKLIGETSFKSKEGRTVHINFELFNGAGDIEDFAEKLGLDIVYVRHLGQMHLKEFGDGSVSTEDYDYDDFTLELDKVAEEYRKSLEKKSSK